MRAPVRKGRIINWGCVGPLLAYLAVAGSVVAAAIFLGHRNHHAAAPAPQALVRPQDELRRELVHCQDLGPKSGDDETCIAAWKENRRRFFEAGVPADTQGRPKP